MTYDANISMLDTNDRTEVRRLIREMLANTLPASLPAQQPGTVTVGGITSASVLLDYDGAAGTAITVANLTGVPLLIGARVMVTFMPPQGVFVTGIIDPIASLPHTETIDFVGGGVYSSAARSETSWSAFAYGETGHGQNPSRPYLTITKASNASLLIAHVAVSRFYNTALAGNYYSVLCNGVSQRVIATVPAGSTEVGASGFTTFTDVPAGVYDVYMQYHSSTGTFVYCDSSNTHVSFSCTETF